MRAILLIILLSICAFSKNVLILNSYSPTFGWTVDQVSSSMKTLKKNQDINVFVEFMDTKNFIPTKEREKNLLTYLNNKYRETPLDAVVITDDNAINFIVKYQKITLFKKAKFFFLGVNNLEFANTLDKNKFAGLLDGKNPLGNLSIAKKLNTKLNTIYIVGDNTVTSKEIIKEYKRKYSTIEDITFIYLDYSNIDTILTKLHKYEKDSVLIFVTFASFEKNLKHLDYKMALENISKVYNNPMLVNSSSSFSNITKTNIVGCACVDGRIKGEVVANGVIKYLQGTPIKDIKFRFSEGNNIYLHEKNLNKFGIKVRDLQLQNPIITNKQKPLFAINKTWFMIFTIIFISIFMFMKIQQNKKIKMLNASLEDQIKEAIFKNNLQNEQMIAQSKLAQMGEMLSMIAHQWRQPLGAINMTIINIKTKLASRKYDFSQDTERKQFLGFLETKHKNIEDHIQFLSNTMDDFSDFFKPSAEKKLISITSPINKTLKIVEKSLESKNIKIISDFKTSNEVLVHENKLTQVILNIIKNSEDNFIEKNTPNPQINISTDQNKETYIISISDNGGGIPKDILPRIFEPYFSTKLERSGTGLGLYMSKVIIEKHSNGTLHVNNTKDGACFEIALLKVDTKTKDEFERIRKEQEN